jgi:hypothetical protein
MADNQRAPSCAGSEVVYHQGAGYFDTYIGTAAALVLAGIVRQDQLPGQPGRGAMSAAYLADGSPKKRGSTLCVSLPGTLRIVRTGADRFRVTLAVSEPEQQQRSHVAALQRARRMELELAPHVEPAAAVIVDPPAPLPRRRGHLLLVWSAPTSLAGARR